MVCAFVKITKWSVLFTFCDELYKKLAQLGKVSGSQQLKVITFITRHTFHVNLCCSATLGGLVAGTGISWTSPVIPRMPFPITQHGISWMVSIRAIGCLVFALPSGKLNDLLGRKPTLILSGLPSLISWLIIAFTRTTPALLVARFLIGIGTAIFTCVTPIYVAEVADKKHRGWLTTLMSLMLILGQVFEYAVGPFVDYTTLALVSAIFPAVFMVLMLFMPESPMYYVMNDRLDSAEKSINLLRGDDDSENQREELSRTVAHVIREQNERSNLKDLVLHKGPRKALLIVFGLFAAQHLSGLMAILMYAEVIFQKSKSKIISPEYAPIIMCMFQLLACIICAFFTDKVGRRPLLLISTAGCGASLVVAGLITFLHHLKVALQYLSSLPLIGITGYFVMFNVGLGPITFVVEGELFPPNMKGLALSICSVYIGLLDFGVTKTFPHLQEVWGQYVLFWLFASVAFLGTVFVFFFVPETKGKEIADIVDEMKGSSFQMEKPPQQGSVSQETSQPQDTDEPNTIPAPK